MAKTPVNARLFCALFLAALAAAPLSAAAAGRAKQRAVAHPNTQKVTISGTVTDSSTGQPLKGVSIIASDTGAATDANGQFTITTYVSANTLTAQRIGYQSVTKTFAGTSVNFVLPQTPSVTIRTTAGETVVLDFDSTKFGYVVIFQGYSGGDELNLCKTGDANWHLNKADISKINGPAHAVDAQSCCSLGPVQAVDFELKSGEKVTGYLNDNCYGYAVDVYGIERSSATPRYIHLTDVAQITFP